MGDTYFFLILVVIGNIKLVYKNLEPILIQKPDINRKGNIDLSKLQFRIGYYKFIHRLFLNYLFAVCSLFVFSIDFLVNHA